jgi:hypothetical protein
MVEIQSNQKVLLVGGQNAIGTAILENSLAVSYKLIYNMNQHFHLGVLTQEK